MCGCGVVVWSVYDDDDGRRIWICLRADFPTCCGPEASFSVACVCLLLTPTVLFLVLSLSLYLARGVVTQVCTGKMLIVEYTWTRTRKHAEYLCMYGLLTARLMCVCVRACMRTC